MLLPMTLSVPIGEPFRALAADMVGKFAELSGCEPQAAALCAADVTAALSGMAAGAARDSVFAVTCGMTAGAVEVQVRSNGHARTIHCALAGRAATG